MRTLKTPILVAVVGLLGPMSCSQQEQPKQPTPSASYTVQLPAEVYTLRARIRQDLLQISQTCEAQKIDSKQIYAALFAADWDNPQADRLGQMPAAIRVKMQQVRDAFARHNTLLATAYDSAEGLVAPAGSVTP